MRAAVEKAPHVVYRCYDATDRLLYIGCTHDIGGRMDVHRSSWGNPVSAVLNLRMTRYTETAYPDKATARQAERDAIYDEAPLLNLHHQKVRVTAASRRRMIDEWLDATQPAPNPETVAALAGLAALFGVRSPSRRTA